VIFDGIGVAVGGGAANAVRASAVIGHALHSG
jgi:hypothetical protein